MLKSSISILAIVSAVMGIAVFGQQNIQRPQNPQTPGTPQQQQPPGTGSISGTVVAMGSNTPVSGASVELRRIDCNNFSAPPEVFNVTTGADGKFSFDKLHAGGWCIVATIAGGKFTPAEYLQRGYKGRGVTIPLIDGEKMAGVTLSMAPTSAISGRITDRDGEPVGHARVQAMELYYENGERRLYILQVVQTNDLGEYRFYWLPPGRYFVGVVPDDILRQNLAFSIPPPGEGGHREDQLSPIINRRIAQSGEIVEESFVPIYYGDVTEQQRSTPIDLLPGANANGMDISLRNARIRSWHIRGTAMNAATGMPAAGAQLRLMPRSWTATVIMPNGVVDGEGHFDIKGVIPGSYTLYANQAGGPAPGTPTNTGPGSQRGSPPPPPQRGAPGPGARSAAGAQDGANGPPPIPPVAARLSVDVGNSNTDNLNFTLTPGFVLNGKVTMEGPAVNGNNSGPRGMRIMLAHDPDLVGLPSPPQTTIQPDGSFMLANVMQGDFRVYLPPLLNTFQWGTPSVPANLQNTYIKSVRLGNTDVLMEGLHLSVIPREQLEVTIGTGGKLNGTVVNERREPAVNATIALIPSDRKRIDWYRATTSDTQGRYKIQGIPPGNYRVFAWEDVERDAWQDPGFMNLIEGRGTTVQITEGGQGTTDLLVIPSGRP